MYFICISNVANLSGIKYYPSIWNTLKKEVKNDKLQERKSPVAARCLEKEEKMRRISKRTVASGIWLTVFCLGILMILSLMTFFVVKTWPFKTTELSKDPVNQRQMSLYERKRDSDQTLTSMEMDESSVKNSRAILGIKADSLATNQRVGVGRHRELSYRDRLRELDRKIDENLRAIDQNLTSMEMGESSVKNSRAILGIKADSLATNQRVGAGVQGKLSHSERILSLNLTFNERMRAIDQKLRSMEQEESMTKNSRAILGIKEDILATNQKVTGEQEQTPYREIKFFVVKILVMAFLLVFAQIVFYSAINSEAVMSIKYRIFIGHIMAFVFAFVLPFLGDGLIGLFVTAFPTAFDFFLSFAILCLVRYCTKSFILTRIFPIDLFLTGFILWIISYLLLIGFEAFCHNGFSDFPIKAVIITGLFGGIGLNIFFLRKEY
jgi:hypothetical protein